MQEKLPVAVIGMGGFGRATLEALLSSQLVEVVALADRDRLVAEGAGRDFEVRAYTDNRLLLIEAQPKAVYLAVPPAAAPDIVSACARHGAHVWKELPLARHLGEGAAMVRCMEQAGLRFAVGTQRRFMTSYARAAQLRQRLGPVFLARAHYLFNWGTALGWRGDRQTAGGGALLELGYHAVDLLIWLLGLPETVFCRCAGGNRPQLLDGGEPQPPYDTDDTATALLQYPDDCMASIVTSRSSGPVSEELSLHGRGGSLTADSGSCVLRDPDGAILDRVTDPCPPINLFRRQAEAFAHAVLADAGKYSCAARENLLNLAVIEAMYLSDRTRQPESPDRLLQTNALSESYCLARRPIPERID